MGVDLGSAGAAVPQVLLDDPQVDAGLEQMGGVGMAQSVDMGALDDAGALQRQSEGTLETAAGDRATVMGQAVLQTAPGGSGGAGDLLFVGQVEEVLAQILLGESVRAGVEMLPQLADPGGVALLSPCGEAPQLHILNHPLMQR